MKTGSITPLTIRDAEIYGDAPTSEVRAKREEYIKCRYEGPRKDLKGKGDAYFSNPMNSWIFRPENSETEDNWFRVKYDSLRFTPKRIKK